MYENMTYALILQRMLNRVTAAVDKREGSIIYDALAPAAAELAELYVELDAVLKETFADTASREFLIRRAAERGIVPDAATCAVVRGVFDVNLPLGSRFSLEGYHYTVQAALPQVQTGQYDFRLVCETAGAEVNGLTGHLLPLSTISGLKRAELTEILVPGEEEEATETLRTRYFAALRSQAFGGNILDYQNRVNQISGVGGVKVYPVWNGGGTVKLVVMSAAGTALSAVLLNEIQTAIDPVGHQGEGMGIAPIGHVVTVSSVTETTVNITASLSYEEGWNWAAVAGYVTTAVDDYFSQLNQQWAEQDNLIVRISQLESRILALDGIVDIEATTLNGVQGNLTLGANAIVKRGSFIAGS